MSHRHSRHNPHVDELVYFLFMALLGWLMPSGTHSGQRIADAKRAANRAKLVASGSVRWWHGL